ncbi:MAG: hypothetical protein HQK94_14860 [Nitrospirae bacterium]|nr:hypothetical protein [Nitrospirota bacterium]
MLNFILNILNKIQIAFSLVTGIFSKGKSVAGTVDIKKQNQNPNVLAVKREFERAVNALKTSKLSHDNTGKSSFYTLPVYLFIGSKGAGKSDFINNSKLEFSHITVQETNDDQAGLCHWWFTKQAVFLDASERFIPGADVAEEWREFINQLVVHRVRKPIDGLVINISIKELTAVDEDGVKNLAVSLRSKVDELIKKFGFVFPIYLVFTNCDEIEGFVDYFGNMTDTERLQPWGFTLTCEQQAESHPEKIFQKEFDKLFERLLNRRLFTMPTVKPTTGIYAAFAFPAVFTGFKSRLSLFAGLLFQRNPYSINPFLRGMYFTSHRQDVPPPVEQQSYFIKSLFTDIIFPDRFLVQLKSHKWTKANILAVSLTSLFLILMLVSFIGNVRLIRGTSKKSVSLKKANSNDPQLQLLDDARPYLERLERYKENGVPLWLGIGFYRGEKINSQSREIYFKKFNNLILDQLQRDMDMKLQASTDADLIKAYNMLTNRNGKIEPFLSPYMFKSLTEGKQADSKLSKEELDKHNRLLARQIDFYLSQFGKPDVPYMTKGAVPVSPTMTDTVYGVVTLKTVMKNHANSTITGGSEFSAKFTKEMWNSKVKEEMRKKGEDEKVYFTDFVEKWRHFVHETSIRPFQSTKDAMAALDELSRVDSPLIYYFKEFSNMTNEIDVTVGGSTKTLIDTEFDKIYAVLGAPEVTKGGLFDNYLKQLNNLRGEIYAADISPQRNIIVRQQVTGQLSGKQGTALTTAWQATQTLLAAIDEKNREAVRPLLEYPVKNTWQLLLKMQQDNITQQWLSDFCSNYNNSLKNKYPFNQGGADATYRDLADFFGSPTGLFSKFYKSEIDPFMAYNNGKLEPRKWIDLGLELHPDFQKDIRIAKTLTDVLFAKGNSAPVFAFEIYPIPIPKVDQILLTIGENKFDYINQPQFWNEIAWSPSGQQYGASIEVSGETHASKKYDGPMGFIKLINDAQFTSAADKDLQIGWQVGNYNVRYKVRTKVPGDVFNMMKELSTFKCTIDKTTK